MKSPEELKAALIEYLVDDIDDDDIQVEHDTPLFSDGLIDSFSMASLIAYVEELSGQQIPHSEAVLQNFDTVDRMVTYIQRLIRT